MPEFNQFPQQPTLLLDASGPHCFAAVFGEARVKASQASQNEALEAIFSLVKHVLDVSQLRLDDISQFIYAEGPGSTLGLRLAAMAISAWKASRGSTKVDLLGYNSLQVAACTINETQQYRFRRALCPWKKSAFFAIDIPEGSSPGQLYPVAREELHMHTTPSCFVHIGRPQESPLNPMDSFPYPTEQFPVTLINHPELLHPIQAAEPHAFRQPEFKKWSSERHRKPVN